MKKLLKIISIILIVTLSIFIIFICEESIRLKHNTEALPIIVTDKTKNCISCIEPGEDLEVEYLSIGYKTKIRYSLSEESSVDNKIIIISGKEFLLFNKIRLWAWIS